MRIEFITSDNMPAKKLADAEIVFEEGDLAGLRLAGFAVWKGESGGFVTFPSRAYNVGAERKYYNFLSSTSDDKKAEYRLKDTIMKAWKSGDGRVVRRESKN